MNITEFQGEYRFLSNFWPAKCSIIVCGETINCPTVEHGYQALKARNNLEIARRIAECGTPAIAKKLGQMVAYDDYQWSLEKRGVMLNLLFQKFSLRNWGLTPQLLATGSKVLQEGNNWRDQYWGICPPEVGEGENWLGQLLMFVRKIRAEERMVDNV